MNFDKAAELIKAAGGKLHWSISTGSTQDEAKNAEFPETGFTVFVANSQNAAYGRNGRRWSAPIGGLWFSLLFKPAVTTSDSWRLPAAAAVASASVLRFSTGINAGLKWPNDIIVRDSEGKVRKLGGILIETHTSGQDILRCTAGFGLNIANTLSDDLRTEAVSLCELTETGIGTEELMAEIVKEFIKRVRPGYTAGLKIIEEFRRLSLIDGSACRVHSSIDIIEGIFNGVDNDFSARIMTAGGEVRVSSGELFL